MARPERVAGALRCVIAAALVSSVLAGPMLAAPAFASSAQPALPAASVFLPTAEQSSAAGAVVGLAGTPHLWVGGDDGALHWVGDTRALSGKTLDWGSKRDVSLADLQLMQRGDPWLSAGLMKSGEPIYFVKWESDWSEPQLLRIQSIADVELFGINGSNYGEMVLEQGAWDQRFGIASGNLKMGDLPSAVQQSAAPAVTAPVSTAAGGGSLVGTNRGVLAGAITDQERAAFVQSALGLAGGTLKHVAKWDEPIKVQLRQTSYQVQSDIVDSVVNEVGGLLGGHPISRVQSGGNIIIDFVPLKDIPGSDSGTLGLSAYHFKSTGALRDCVIQAAQDPESILGNLSSRVSPQMKSDLFALVVRHEFGHCLGLGHNSANTSFMSYSYDPWDRYYTAGSRNTSYVDFDRALIRTLYHSAVKVGMVESDLNALFNR